MFKIDHIEVGMELYLFLHIFRPYTGHGHSKKIGKAMAPFSWRGVLPREKGTTIKAELYKDKQWFIIKAIRAVLGVVARAWNL